MFDRLTKAVGPRLGRFGFTVKEKTPELYLISGLVTGAAAAIMLAKAHKKSEDVFKDVVEDIERTQEYKEQKIDEGEPLSKQEEVRLLTPLVVEGAQRAVVLYGPSILMGAASILFFMASHGTLKRRNRALMATVSLISKGFGEYRKRVIEEYGKEVDERLYYGADTRNVTTLTQEEDGKKKRTKSKENVIPEEFKPIMYQRIFDDTNKCWQHDPDLNAFFLRSVEDQANDWLYLRGHVMLNDVYDALGFARSPEGAVVGWSQKKDGDGYIDFGLNSSINKKNGDNRYVLDFNVQGVVFEYI